MLFINNGVPKSGSVWLHNISRDILGGDKSPSDQWRRDDWGAPSIHPDRLADYLSSGEHLERDVLIKTHLPAKEPYLSLFATEGVVPILTIRNLMDSILSLYHHHKRKGWTTLEIADWWEEKGQFSARGHIRHRDGWHEASHVFSFEERLRDPIGEIMRLATVLGAEISPTRAYEIAQSRSAQRQGDPTGRIRTGTVGRAITELPQHIYFHLREMEAGAKR